MRRAVLAAAVLAAIGMAGAMALAAAPPAKHPPPAAKPPAEPTRAEVLTKRLRDLENKLRTGSEKDPDLRKRLPDDIEKTKQELGPHDSSGARIHPQAMWHDVAIDTLDAEIKRFSMRAKAGGAGAAALDARIDARRMAQVCLTRGWTWGHPLKYQFDAYGQYLANNMAVIDGVFDDVAAALTKETTLAPTAPDHDAFVAALAEARNGIAAMEKAVNQFANTDPRADGGRTKIVAALRLFADALQTVYEAEGTCRELSEKQKTPAAAPAAGAPPGETPPPPPGLTDEDKTRLEMIRAVAAGLDDAKGWLNIRTALERFATVAEQGLQVPRARAGAMEMLDCLFQAAEYCQGLARSKSASPALIAKRQKALEEAFGYLEKKEYRRDGYGLLHNIAAGDHLRRALDTGPLSPDASQGLLSAAELSYRVFKDPNAGEQCGADASTIIRIVGQLRHWPPEDMTPQMLPMYKPFADVFIQSAETAGKMPQTAPDELCQPFAMAALFGRDLERLIRIDQAVRLVAQYAPARASTMHDQLIKQFEGFAQSVLASKRDERIKFDEFIKPILRLANLQLPTAEQTAIAMKLSGNTYKNAVTIFARDLANGLTWASPSKGTATGLEAALEAEAMFRLLRHRSVAETIGLGRAGTANLDAFSLPEKTWGMFLTAQDQHLRHVMMQYAATDPRSKKPSAAFLGAWNQVYCWVAAAQRLTGPTRRAGETEMDVLLRHLGRVSDPSPPDSARRGWIAGYHATEAAMALTAGFDYVAAWHRMAVSEWGGPDVDRELGAAVLDPMK